VTDTAIGARPARWGATRVTIIGLLAAYAGGRIVILFGGRVFTTYDTFGYAYRTDPFYDRGPLVSFTGHAPRLWGTPLFMAIFPTDHARAIGMSTVGAIGWALLALAVAGGLRRPAAKMVAVASVLAVGLTPDVTNWDFSIMSEPLSITFGVLVLAALIRWLTNRSSVALVGGTVAAGWWTFMRPELGLLVVFVFVTIVFVGWRRRQWLALSCAVVLAASMVWVVAITPTMSRSFARYSATGLSLDEETLTFRLKYVVFPSPAVKEVYEKDLGMPDCAAVTQAARRKAPTGPFGNAYRSCPALKAWGEQNAQSSGYRFALDAPGLYAKQTWNALPDSLVGGTMAHVPDPVPLVSAMVFPARKFVVPGLFGGLLLVVIGASIAGAWRRRRTLLLVTVWVAIASAASTLGGMLYTAGALPRFGIQEAIGFRLALLVGILTLGDVLLERIHERRRAVAAMDHEALVAAGADRVAPTATAVLPAQAISPAEAILPTQAIPAEAPSAPTFPTVAESRRSPAFDTAATESVPAVGAIDTVPAIVTQAAPPEDGPVTTTLAGTDPNVTNEPVG
jgi:hypothetical protein